VAVRELAYPRVVQLPSGLVHDMTSLPANQSETCLVHELTSLQVGNPQVGVSTSCSVIPSSNPKSFCSHKLIIEMADKMLASSEQAFSVFLYSSNFGLQCDTLALRLLQCHAVWLFSLCR